VADKGSPDTTALRLWPSVFITIRFASRDAYMPRGGGPDGQSPCFVGKGERVWVGINALQRRKDLWGPDADEFRPERWGEENFHPGLGYFPFGTGQRVCIGQQTALTTVAYTLVRLMQACPNLENRDPRPYVETLRVVSDSKHGALVGLAKV
jgi:cytochrome P450